MRISQSGVDATGDHSKEDRFAHVNDPAIDHDLVVQFIWSGGVSRRSP